MNSLLSLTTHTYDVRCFLRYMHFLSFYFISKHMQWYSLFKSIMISLIIHLSVLSIHYVLNFLYKIGKSVIINYYCSHCMRYGMTCVLIWSHLIPPKHFRNIVNVWKTYKKTSPWIHLDQVQEKIPLRHLLNTCLKISSSVSLDDENSCSKRHETFYVSKHITK